MSNGFDLSAAKPVADREDEGTVVHLLDVHSEPMYYGDDKKPVTVRVAGTFSATYRRAEQASTDRRLKRGMRSVNSETLTKDRLNVTAACVLGWEGFFNNGKPIPCDRTNVVTVLEAAPWIRQQIETAMEDHEAFFSGSSET